MTECTTCRGQGLIGSGENPHNLQGAVITCTDCGGTGKVADGLAPTSVDETATLSPREELVEALGEVEVEKTKEAPVDNSTSAEDVQGV